MATDGAPARQRVVSLSRYAVKSAAPEVLPTVTVEATGIVGDRQWAVFDVADGTVLSAKHPARGGRLLEVRPATDELGVTLDVPGSAPVRAGTPAADGALSEWLGRAVRLSSVVPVSARLHRIWPEGFAPSWVSDPAGADVVTDISGVGHRRFVDFGALHAVTTGQLAALRADVGADVDASVFRPNLVLDLACDPAPGERIQVGETVLRCLLQTPRCVVPSLPRGGVAPPAALLRTLARTRRIEVGDRGRAACFGVYLEVERAGQVAVGDAVTLLS